MSAHTYYSILGVSKNADAKEITHAKNALAKIYHPDANINNNIDTTANMQEILEAYHVLSDPRKRKEYDQKLGYGTQRNFCTFTIKKEKDLEEEDISFVTYWNAASKLYDIVKSSMHLFKQEKRHTGFLGRLLRRFGWKSRREKETDFKIKELSRQAFEQVSLLKKSEIPIEFWQPEAMNWVLVRWAQNQSINYFTLFAGYEAFVDQNMPGKDRVKLRSREHRFEHHLKKLLAYL